MDTSQLRVLEVIQSLGKGGRTTRFVDTVNGLKSKGVYIVPLCFSEPEPWVTLKDLRVIKRKEGVNWLLVKKIMHCINRHNINVIHTHCELSQLYTGIAGFLCNIKVVGTFHRSDLARYQPNLVNKLIRFFVSEYVAVSHDRLSLLTNNLKFPKKACHVVHGGTHIDNPPSNELIQQTRKSLVILKDQIALLSIGHLGHIKGHQDTITALATITHTTPNVHLYIAGDGNSKEKQTIIEQISSLKLQKHITLLGQINNVKEWLCACDIFVQPSIEEAFGLVFIEAGAQAKPVVATCVGGIKEIIIDKETGFLVSPSKPTELANKLNLLINSTAQRVNIGENAYRRVKTHFSISSMINNYLNIFKLTNE